VAPLIDLGKKKKVPTKVPKEGLFTSVGVGKGEQNKKSSDEGNHTKKKAEFKHCHFGVVTEGGGA